MINQRVTVLALVVGCGPSSDRTPIPAATRSTPFPTPAPSAAPPPATADDTIMAASNFREPITYRKVRCGARFAAGAEKCHAVEQGNLQTPLSARHRRCGDRSPGGVGADERAEVEERVLAEHASGVDATRKFHAAIDGAARVRAGESFPNQQMSTPRTIAPNRPFILP